jgi:CubicO group peptidase (beta-lactamase class C family)
MHTSRAISTLIVAGAVVSASAEHRQTIARTPLAAQIEAYFEPLVLDQQVSGSLLVTDHGAPIYQRSFGQANFELGVDNTSDTVFGVASITKIMTFAITSQLVDERVLSLDDPIAKWLPEFPSAAQITVRHLVEHKSGIPHRVTTDAEEALPHSAADMVALAATRPLMFEPGSKAVYSSTGYTVLARVLELASGHSYAELVRSRIFDRAGMTSSYQPAANELIPRRAADYLASWPGIRRAPLKDLSFLVGAGSVYSTPRDLLLFVAAARDGRLGASTKNSSTVNRDVLLWQGSNNGFRSFISDTRSSGISVAFTGNLRSGAVERLSTDLPAIAGGGNVVPPPRLDVRAVEMSPALQRDYAGEYGVLDQSWRADVEPRLLMLGGRSFVPVGPDRFFAIDDYGELRAVRDDHGRLVGFDWTSKGSTLCAVQSVAE